MWIAECPLNVRVAMPFPQRRVSAVIVMDIRYIVNVRYVRDVDNIDAVAAPAVPGIKAVTRAAR
jgi:hypothetical protein